MNDICFVVAPQNRDGILDRIAHEIGKAFNSPTYFYGGALPEADRYFVTHYSLMPSIPFDKPVFCLFTHNKGNLQHFLEYFNRCAGVIAESPEGVEILRGIGVRNELLSFVPEGADPLVFKPHTRTKDGAILVCGTNYSDGRKNPEMVRAVQSLLISNHRTFHFIGSGWINRINDNYADYPEEYKECSVYLSCSKLEGGGPNSLIEAMHANLVPVVSDTGNARQYIQDGYNGYIFPHTATAQDIANLIEKAYALVPQNAIPYNDVWQTIKSFTWDAYSLQMYELITGDNSITQSQGHDTDDPSYPDTES